MENSALVAISVFIGMVAAFTLGWDIAEDRERKASNLLRRQKREIERQKYLLTQWVRQNWPDAYAAYKQGHSEGYQQGTLQSDDNNLRADELNP